MTEQEFYQAVENQPYKADMLVRIKMKYSCDKEYEYLKEDSYIKTLYVRNSNPVARFFLFTYGEKYEIHVSQDKIKDARLGSPR